MNKTALITGITGQDGSFLAEFYWIKVMMYMERFVGHRLIIVKG